MEKSKYFDWAATGICDTKAIIEAATLVERDFANPSAIHSAGRAAHSLLEHAREDLAGALCAKKEQLYFTSGATESNQIILTSLLNRPSRGTILIGAAEHPSIHNMAQKLKNCGFRVVEVPLETSGQVNPSTVASLLTPDTQLVAIMHTNNEMGAINDIAAISQVIKEKSAGRRQPIFHVDAVQSLGKIPFDLSVVDSASFAAHKIGGPRGTGLLFLGERARLSFEPFLYGGGQEASVRSGTENVLGAVAFSKVLCNGLSSGVMTGSDWTSKALLARKELTAYFIEEIGKINGCTVLPRVRAVRHRQGENDGAELGYYASELPEQYSPYIVQASFEKIPGQVMVRALDDLGFAISTGSACSSRKKSRRVLLAMKIPGDVADNAVRFSFGFAKNPLDEEYASLKVLIAAIKEVCERF